MTTSDGSPSFVTSRPLNRPQTAPTISAVAMQSQSGQPAAQVLPITALESPSVDATERSISPLMMINVIGSAISAFSMLLVVISVIVEPWPKTSDVAQPIAISASSMREQQRLPAPPELPAHTARLSVRNGATGG